jgi:hypothetical protein
MFSLALDFAVPNEMEDTNHIIGSVDVVPSLCRLDSGPDCWITLSQYSRENLLHHFAMAFDTMQPCLAIFSPNVKSDGEVRGVRIIWWNRFDQGVQLEVNHGGAEFSAAGDSAAHVFGNFTVAWSW